MVGAWEDSLRMVLPKASDALTSYVVYSESGFTNIQTLGEKVRSLMQKSKNLAKRGGRRADKCTVCGKEGEQKEITNHIEVNHLEGVAIPCNHCDKTFRSVNGFRVHNAKWHK